MLYSNGKFEAVEGEQLIYYPGEEENFVDSLPEKVIDVVIKRYLTQEKGEWKWRKLNTELQKKV